MIGIMHKRKSDAFSRSYSNVIFSALFIRHLNAVSINPSEIIISLILHYIYLNNLIHLFFVDRSIIFLIMLEIIIVITDHLILKKVYELLHQKFFFMKNLQKNSYH